MHLVKGACVRQPRHTTPNHHKPSPPKHRNPKQNQKAGTLPLCKRAVDPAPIELREIVANRKNLPRPGAAGNQRAYARCQPSEENQTPSTQPAQTTNQQNPTTPTAKTPTNAGGRHLATIRKSVHSAVAAWQACRERHGEKRTPTPRRQTPNQPKSPTTTTAPPKSGFRACPPSKHLIASQGERHSAQTVRDDVPLLSDLTSNPQSEVLKKGDCSLGSAKDDLCVHRRCLSWRGRSSISLLAH